MPNIPFRSPCCFIVMNTKVWPARGHMDRTCPRCLRFWRFERSPGGAIVATALAQRGRNVPQRVAGLRHGTREGRDKYRCPCDACIEAKRLYQEIVQQRGRARRPQPLGVHGRSCGPCARREPHFIDKAAEQRVWAWAHRRGYDWTSYRAAILAVVQAIHVFGRTHQPPAPPLDLGKVAILARHERRVIYILDGRHATLRRPPHGPYIEVWPSGNVTSVGDPRQYAA